MESFRLSICLIFIIRLRFPKSSSNNSRIYRSCIEKAGADNIDSKLGEHSVSLLFRHVSYLDSNAFSQSDRYGAAKSAVVGIRQWLAQETHPLPRLGWRILLE